MSKVKNIDEFYKLKSQENHALEEATGIANQLFKKLTCRLFGGFTKSKGCTGCQIGTN